MMAFILSLNFTTLAVGVVTFWILIKLLRRPKNLPPGPWGIPVFGCIPQLMLAGINGKHMREVFLNWYHKYGPIYNLNIGSANVVILNDFKSIKDALVKPEFQDRIKFDITLGRGGDGLVMSSGPTWLEQRKFVYHHFREFGVGKASFEDAISIEATFLTDALLAFDGKVTNIGHLVNNAVSNVISSVSFGQRFDYDDKRFQRVLEKLDENMQSSMVRFCLSVFLPFTQYIPFGGTKRLSENLDAYFQFHNDLTAEHKAKFDEDNIKDVMDGYLLEMKKGDDAFSDENMVWTIGDLFAAGTETTTTTLMWAFLFMLKNPEIEAKLKSQLDQVVGHNRLPRYSDRPNLPYIDALISECLRMGTTAAISLPHVASEDSSLHGFHIPKGTILIPNNYALFTEKSKWEDPDVFRPERFLDKDGKLIKREDFIPFSIGRRLCLGEQLARMELFIFLSYIMHRMSFSIPEGHMTPSTEGSEGFSYKPLPYDVLIRKREEQHD